MRTLASALLLVLGLTACATTGAPPAEVRATAREAYLYGFPMIESYKTIYAYAVDEGGPQYKAPFNQLKNEARVYTPRDTAVVTPNSDTPYSFVMMDLRAEPFVLSVPGMEGDRYFSVQLVDLYTHNFAYIGTRATGNFGGTFLVAGPDWNGKKPRGVEKILRCETQIALAIYRTQLTGPADMKRVEEIQAEYQVQPLSAFTRTPAPASPSPIEWPQPEKGVDKSVEFFRTLDFLLQFAPTHPSERALRERMAAIGIGAGFDPATLTPETRSALEAGIRDAEKDYEALQERIAAKEVTSGDMFGTRAYLKNNYLFRFAAARIGLFGNSREEAFYPISAVDADGAPLDASSSAYTLTLGKRDLAAAKAFWSVTMYDGKTQMLIDNPLDRYLINSPMLESLQKGSDGSITLYIQKDPPGEDKESNWLPAPDGPFYMVFRLYIPAPEVIEGKWEAPAVQRAGK
jgi:hypothetical protein